MKTGREVAKKKTFPEKFFTLSLRKNLSFFLFFLFFIVSYEEDINAQFYIIYLQFFSHTIKFFK